MHNIKTRLGHDDEQWFPVSLGMNEKGGMDDAEFEGYVMNALVALFPDAKDEDGKRVIIKIDSGPGRANMQLLAKLKLLGIILYPGVPNTTSVTQETDQSYGLFKSIFRQNLEDIVNDRIDNRNTSSVSPWEIGLLVFGGKDRVTGKEGYRNAFAEAFSVEKNKEAWAKVGAAPLTRACLESPKVRHELGSELDPLASNLRRIQDANSVFVQSLNTLGYDGELFRATVKERQDHLDSSITAPNSQERIQALMNAKTHGEKFYVTGGAHATSDDIFKAAELSNRKHQISDMEKNKKLRKSAEEKETAAFRIIHTEKPTSRLTAAELETLLAWHGVAKSKMGKKVEDKRQKWMEIKSKGTGPPQYEKWTEADEEELSRLKSSEVSMADTAVGRERENCKRLFKATFKSMSEEDKRKCMEELNAELNNDANNDST